MKRTLIFGSVIVTMAASTAVMATAKQGGEGPRGVRGMLINFTDLDLNGDGLITLDEVREQRDARFAAADADGDGLLSADELTAQSAERAAERVAKMIAQFDENDDGMLSVTELPKPRGGQDRAERIFERLDADGDGAITEAEFAELPNMRRCNRWRKDRD